MNRREGYKLSRPAPSFCANSGGTAGLIRPLLCAVALVGAMPIAAEGSGKAVVLTGDVSDGASMRRVAIATAGEAESDFEDAGYSVSRDDSATKAEAIAAISGANVEAVYILAHGDPCMLGKKTVFREGVLMADKRWLVATDFNTTFPHVREVIIHS